MASDLGKIGPSVVQNTGWGTHRCLFYDTKQDLLDTLVQFFKSGLESGDFCLWIISDPLTEEEALDTLHQSIPNLDRHLREQTIELVPYPNWYFDHGTFNSERAVRQLQTKLDQALARGSANLRATADSGWVDERHWEKLLRYEADLDESMHGRPVALLCTYPLSQSRAAEMLGTIHAHQAAASMRHGVWEVIETPESRQAREQIRTLSDQLEKEVASRTRALRLSNEKLKKEIEDRKAAEDELRRQKEVLQKIFDHIPVMINFMAPGGRIKLTNREWEKTLGWTLEEIRGRKLDIIPEFYPDKREQQRVRDFIAGSNGEWSEFKTRARDGQLIDTSWVNVKLGDGTSIGIGLDVTERKRDLERLQATTTQLRALSANLQAGREEDRSRVARLIHDELGSAFSSLKWDLEALEKTIAKPLDSSEIALLQARIASMMKLADGTINTVRRIAWELRPSILDDLGLLEAIEWQARQFEARTGIVCRRIHVQDDIRFSEEQSTAIFRIFQEALTNVVRHAQATRVDVKMTNEKGIFTLTVRDNGRGITGVEKSGLGILGMQERVRMLGAKLEIHGVEGHGTTITVRLHLGGAGSNLDDLWQKS